MLGRADAVPGSVAVSARWRLRRRGGGGSRCIRPEMALPFRTDVRLLEDEFMPTSRPQDEQHCSRPRLTSRPTSVRC